MKSYLLWTVSGPRTILTSCDLAQKPDCMKMIANTGIKKFIAQEIPVDLAKERYGEHFDIIANDPEQTDELRMMDTEGARAISLFSFKELGPPMYYEEEFQLS